MNYILFSYAGDCFPLAYKLQQEGHNVTVGQVHDLRDIHANIEKNIGEEDEDSHQRRLSLYDGMIVKEPAHELIRKMQQYPHPEDYFVFFDRNNLFKFAQQIVQLGFHGNFPTEEDYLFEMDREAAKAFVRSHYSRLHVAEVKEFATVREATEFLEATDEIWVLKGKDERAKTFIPDVDDVKLAAGQIIQALENKKGAYEFAGFILEPLISRSVELTPERIYYDGTLIACTLAVENKPFGSGNVSMQTGCAQDLVFPISMTDRINEIAFPPIVDELAKKHKGLFYWDASILIDRRTRKMYFGEFCANRAGYNTLFTEIVQCPTAHHYFLSLRDKKNPFTLGTVGSSVTIFNPTNEKHTDHPPAKSPIDYKERAEKDLWLWDARKENGRLVTAGFDWNLAVITGAGKSIEEAVNKMYRSVDDFSFVGSYFRPKFDYLSFDYPTSILNRLNYGLDRGLYQLPFNVKVGNIL